MIDPLVQKRISADLEALSLEEQHRAANVVDAPLPPETRSKVEYRLMVQEKVAGGYRSCTRRPQYSN